MSLEKHLIESIRHCCEELSSLGDVLENSSRESKKYQDAFKSSAIYMIKLKETSRNLHKLLEEKRKIVDAGKSRVDSLQLKLENLLYKQAYLEREISTCKSLSIPATLTLESEIETKLTASLLPNELRKFHEEMVQTLKEEKKSRIATKEVLERAQLKLQSTADILEKKRKFLDVDLPAKVSVIQTNASEIEPMFTAVSDNI